MRARALALLAALSLLSVARPAIAQPVRVASKSFTEGVILGEIAAQLIAFRGAAAEHRRQLGGTQVVFEALLHGDIDLYVDYTGTLREQIFAGQARTDADLERLLAARGLRMSRPLGFHNTYEIGLRRDVAERLGLRRISDLAAHPSLRFGFSAEFMERKDGWPGLKERYGLPQSPVGLEHDLAYRGIQAGDFDGTDVNSTDAEVRTLDLRLLEDDRRYFPDYQAVIVYRAELPARVPAVAALLAALPGHIDEEAMRAMNARAHVDRVSESEIAAEFLRRQLGVAATVQRDSRLTRIGRRTVEHLSLVLLSLLAAILCGVPLGILSARRPLAGQAILAVTGTIQTLPSLALLVFLIPLLGIGVVPATVALFLYSLLPIVRNTFTALRDIPPPLRESAEALGLPRRAQLVRIELPLSARAILAGIKTSAVINVGTATIGAIIGAGGYGQPILTGIRLNDTGIILEGAVPAAAMALLVQGMFEILERAIVPRGLRVR